MFDNVLLSNLAHVKEFSIVFPLVAMARWTLTWTLVTKDLAWWTPWIGPVRMPRGPTSGAEGIVGVSMCLGFVYFTLSFTRYDSVRFYKPFLVWKA